MFLELPHLCKMVPEILTYLGYRKSRGSAVASISDTMAQAATLSGGVKLLAPPYPLGKPHSISFLARY